MSPKIDKILLLSIVMIISYSCAGVTPKDIKKEIYVVYDDSWTQFGAKKDPIYEYEVKKEGYLLVIKNPYGYKYPCRVYRRPFNRRYRFIGKFLIDKDKNISFVPITSSKKFNQKRYKEGDIKNIKRSCRIAAFNWESIQEYYEYRPEVGYGKYYDIEKKSFMPLTKEHPKYFDYFLFGLGNDTPQYLVIKNEYGKQLMENGIILPDPNELKNNIVWQDWYNYWGLTDYKIEIP